jgi:hypothetical protein
VSAAASTSHARARFVLAGWFVLALAAGASGVATQLRPPKPQVLVLALTIALVLAERRIAWVRATVATTSLRALVALHVTRFVGFAFLAFAAQGVLPRAWAVPAGVGDIAVAALALALVGANRPAVGRMRTLYLAWNVLGTLDLALVVIGAARLAMADPSSMSAMLHLPLFVVPCFLVPILLASHAWIFMRLLVERREW